MKIAPLPVNEQERLKALSEYHILDTLPECEFDDITRIASAVCNTPISLITIIDADRQWFKSNHGLSAIESETSRDLAFCSHAINTPDEVFIVPDSSKDDRFFDNPFVTGEPHVAFYAGVPLVNPEGYALGTLCVLDTATKQLDAEQVKTLQALARQIVCQLELKRKVHQLRIKQEELEKAYEDLESFSTIASHDLKSPLNNIISLTYLLRENHIHNMDEEAQEYLNFLDQSSKQLSDLIKGILHYSKSSQLITDATEKINIAGLVEEVRGLILLPSDTTLTSTNCDHNIYSSRIALKQILLNLINNAIKYNDKEQKSVEIVFSETPAAFTIEVKDNGPGVKEEDKEKMFNLFERLNNKAADDDGTGVGLAIVKRLTGKLLGSIDIISSEGKGTSFVITVPK